MGHIRELVDVDLTDPVLVEGLPGVGLVGKIAADHLVSTLSMTHFANVHCDAVPKITVYQEGEAELATPVRLYADEDSDLVVLQSDVPIAPAAATEFGDCMTAWFDGQSVTPLYTTGIPTEERTDPPAVYGVGVGDGCNVVAELDLPNPGERGAISGPTGALLAHALEHQTTAVGLLVEADPQFPDPTGAKALIERGVEPVADVDCAVDELVEQAEQIGRARERLAKRMGRQTEESSKAKPLRMYQ